MGSRESPAPPLPPPGMAVVGPPNSYTPTIPNNTTANSMMQNPLFAYNSMVTSGPTTMDSLNSQYTNGSQSSGLISGGGFSADAAKKKRGRPRKYSPDGNIALGLASPPVSSMGHGDSTVASPSSTKRSRGRPAGSGKKQLDALGSSGVGFTPHVILVNAGEDIAAKIREFSQQGPRTVCILSANGAICSVTLRQPAMSSGTVTYEGRFEIISLSGSLLLSENNGNLSRTGSLCVSLAGPDGRVLGGGVEGRLVAATSVQVIVGSFVEDKRKSKSGISSPPPFNILNFGAPAAAASAPSQGVSSESSEENHNGPLNPGDSGFYNNTSQPIHGMPMYSNMDWHSPR